jgi:hypothetical protein
MDLPVLYHAFRNGVCYNLSLHYVRNRGLTAVHFERTKNHRIFTFVLTHMTIAPPTEILFRLAMPLTELEDRMKIFWKDLIDVTQLLKHFG